MAFVYPPGCPTDRMPATSTYLNRTNPMSGIDGPADSQIFDQTPAFGGRLPVAARQIGHGLQAWYVGVACKKTVIHDPCNTTRMMPRRKDGADRHPARNTRSQFHHLAVTDHGYQSRFFCYKRYFVIIRQFFGGIQQHFAPHRMVYTLADGFRRQSAFRP